MRTRYLIEKELRLLDLLVVVLSSWLAQKVVTAVLWFPHSPILPLIVAGMPMVTYLVAREIARHTAVLQPLDLLNVIRRDWAAALFCVAILILGAFFNSWVTLVPVVSAFVLRAIDKGYQHLNEALMGVMVYRFVWYLLAVIPISILAYSSASPQLLGMFTVLALGYEIYAAFGRSIR